MTHADEPPDGDRSRDADAFGRSAAFWLRAYPYRWRDERGAEAADLLADLAAPGATRLDARTAAGTVVAGWRARWRGRPPAGPWLAYRLLRVPLPARYREWSADDIRGAGFPFRDGLIGIVFVGVQIGYLVSHDVVGPVQLVSFTLLLLACVGLELMTAQRHRLAAIRRYLVAEPEEVPVLGGYVLGRVPRSRLRARRTWALATDAAGVVALVCAPVALATRQTSAPVVACAIALTVGVAVAAVAARRLHRLGVRPEQPARRMVDVRPAALRGAALALVALAGGVVVEVSLADQLVLTPALGVTALGALPMAVVGRRFAARADGDLAAVDVLHVALRGAAPPVEELVSGPVRVRDRRGQSEA